MANLQQAARPDRLVGEMFGLIETGAKLAAAVGAGKRLRFMEAPPRG